MIKVVIIVMLDYLHLSMFLNAIGLSFELVGFAWILIKERKHKDQQQLMIRPTMHIDDIENPIIKLQDLEKQALDDIENTMASPIAFTHTNDIISGTKFVGISFISLGFFLHICALFFDK